ncbi:MAG TPA: hypothetical protein VFX45_10795 [Solirubrobacterales bacterium]|nr:hypothetical protein [Solirubrobacterales bacterium]
MLVALASVVVGAVFGSGSLPGRLFWLMFTGIVTAAICFFLLRGRRWLWIVVLVLIPLSLGLSVAAGSVPWFGVVFAAVSLILLLHHDTRLFFRRDEGWKTTLRRGAIEMGIGALAFVVLYALFVCVAFTVSVLFFPDSLEFR